MADERKEPTIPELAARKRAGTSSDAGHGNTTAPEEAARLARAPAGEGADP